jgi:tetratricopeptide (TPR) repeat protein
MKLARICAIGLAVLALLWIAPAQADGSAGCFDYEKDAAARIADCTEALGRSDLDPLEKARLLDARAWNYHGLAEYQEAEADFTAIIADATFSQRLLFWFWSLTSGARYAESEMPYGDAFMGRSGIETMSGKWDAALDDANFSKKWVRSPARMSDAQAEVAWVQWRKGDTAAAEVAYREALSTDPQNAYPEFLLSSMLFDLGRDAEALPLLRHAAAGDTFSGYPALWLYIHSPEGEAKDALRQYLGSATSWPAPIARFYLGEMDADTLLHAAEGPNAAKTREQLCEAHYYIAEALRIAGKTDAARAQYQAVLDTGVNWFVEYNSAQRRLAKL